MTDTPSADSAEHTELEFELPWNPQGSEVYSCKDELMAHCFTGNGWENDKRLSDFIVKACNTYHANQQTIAELKTKLSQSEQTFHKSIDESLDLQSQLTATREELEVERSNLSDADCIIESLKKELSAMKEVVGAANKVIIQWDELYDNPSNESSAWLAEAVGDLRVILLQQLEAE